MSVLMPKTVFNLEQELRKCAEKNALSQLEIADLRMQVKRLAVQYGKALDEKADTNTLWKRYYEKARADQKKAETALAYIEERHDQQIAKCHAELAYHRSIVSGLRDDLQSHKKLSAQTYDTLIKREEELRRSNRKAVVWSIVSKLLIGLVTASAGVNLMLLFG